MLTAEITTMALEVSLFLNLISFDCELYIFSHEHVHVVRQEIVASFSKVLLKYLSLFLYLFSINRERLCHAM